MGWCYAPSHPPPSPMGAKTGATALLSMRSPIFGFVFLIVWEQCFALSSPVGVEILDFQIPIFKIPFPNASQNDMALLGLYFLFVAPCYRARDNSMSKKHVLRYSTTLAKFNCIILCHHSLATPRANTILFTASHQMVHALQIHGGGSKLIGCTGPQVAPKPPSTQGHQAPKAPSKPLNTQATKEPNLQASKNQITKHPSPLSHNPTCEWLTAGVTGCRAAVGAWRVGS